MTPKSRFCVGRGIALRVGGPARFCFGKDIAVAVDLISRWGDKARLRRGIARSPLVAVDSVAISNCAHAVLAYV
jgi:hypothetical protein